MSQTINLNGQLVLVNGNLRNLLNLALNITTTGSNSVCNNMNVTTGSWQQIPQGSNTDFRFGIFKNIDTVSTIKLAVTDSGTSSYATLLQPGDTAILTNNGAANLWAYASGSNGTAVLQYIISEK